MMETQDEVQQGEVQEVRVHAISLRRPRAKRRAPAPSAPPVSPAAWRARMVDSLRNGLSMALEPPQQSWLALLGLSSFAVKGSGQAWSALVREGSDVQAELNRLVNNAARRAGLPFVRQIKEARPPGAAGG
jgi:hypothetical protein